MIIPQVPDGPIDAEPMQDPAWSEQRRAVPFTDEVRARLVREDQEVLLRELDAAGVELGDDDRRIIAWLAGFEISTIVTVAARIKRAHATGKAGQ